MKVGNYLEPRTWSQPVKLGAVSTKEQLNKTFSINTPLHWAMFLSKEPVGAIHKIRNILTLILVRSYQFQCPLPLPVLSRKGEIKQRLSWLCFCLTAPYKVCKTEGEPGKDGKPGGGLFTLKSVKFVGLPPTSSPDSGSPLSTRSLLSSKRCSATAFLVHYERPSPVQPSLA